MKPYPAITVLIPDAIRGLCLTMALPILLRTKLSRFVFRPRPSHPRMASHLDYVCIVSYSPLHLFAVESPKFIFSSCSLLSYPGHVSCPFYIYRVTRTSLNRCCVINIKVSSLFTTARQRRLFPMKEDDHAFVLRCTVALSLLPGRFFTYDK